MVIRREIVIVGGDINFISGQGEVWGESGRADPLDNFFLKKIYEVGLCDLELV
jgi:hypothetical protein